MKKTAFGHDFEMEYDVFGRGEEAMVILPGLSLKSVLFSADAIEAAFAGFADRFTIYMPDVRKDLPDHYLLERFADDTAEVLTGLHVRKASVFGASMGGMVGQLLAIRHPECVGRLVLGATMCRVTPLASETFTLWNTLAASGNAAELTKAVIGRVYSPDVLAVSRDALLDAFSDLSAEEMRRCEILTRAMLRFSSLGALKNIGCPVLALGSRGDRVLGFEGTEEIAAAIGCEQYLYPANFGHAVYDEAPDFLDRIDSFFTAASK